MDAMAGMYSTMHVTAVDAMLIGSVAWAMLTSGIFVHRWLSKAAGHPIGQSPTVKMIP